MIESETPITEATAGDTMNDEQYVINRLEEALKAQDSTDGQISQTPTVGYCFECDEVSVDGWRPDGCGDHPTVSSDGYEHGGIQAALTTLRYLQCHD